MATKKTATLKHGTDKQGTPKGAPETTPKSMVSQIGKQQARVTAAHVTVDDAIRNVGQQAVTANLGRFGLVCSVALVAIYGVHLQPSGKAIEMSVLRDQIGKAIDDAMGTTGAKSTYNMTVNTALSLYRKVVGITANDKLSDDFGGIIAQLAEEKDIDHAQSDFLDYVKGKVCDHTKKAQPSFDGLQQWCTGTSSNASKQGTTGSTKDKAAMDLKNILGRVARPVKAIEELVASRATTGEKLQVVNTVGNSVPRDLLPDLVATTFERLAKIDFKSAQTLLASLQSILERVHEAMPVASSDTAKPTGDAAIAQKDAVADHTETKRRGNKGEQPVVS